jgi:hypothetical protein
VADELQRWFEAGAVDGYSFHLGHPSQTRRLLDDVLPILRDRGVLRREYEGSTLRQNLGLPFVENRYTVARQAAPQSRPAEERQPVAAH